MDSVGPKTRLAASKSRGMRTVGLLAGLAVIAFVSRLAIAQETPSTAQMPTPSWETSPDSMLAAALRTIEGAPISLDEAMNQALAGATSAKEAEARLADARGALMHERGAFDPELFANWTRTSDDQLGSSVFSGADTLKTDQTTANGGVRMRLPFGTEVSAGVEVTKLESNSELAALMPEYDANGVLRVRQPLLKGFGPAAGGELSATKQEYSGARESYRDAIAALKTEVETTYWDLSASEQDLGVRIAIRSMAEALLQVAKLRNAAGLVGPNQIANARVFLAEQVQAVIDGEERLDAVSDRLATLMGTRANGAPRYRASTDPPASFATPSEEEALALAMEASPELKASELNLRAAEARARAAKWDALPTLDLEGSLGGNGLSGRPRDIVFGGDTLRTSVDGDRGEAISQALGRDFPTWSVGLTLSLPIGLRADRGDRMRAEATRRLAEQSYIATRRSLEERVRAACRELEHGAARLEAAREGIDASLEQVRIGRIEYRNGRTTAFELVRLGADLASAQQRYSTALVRTASAAAELRRLTGEAAPLLR